MPADSVNFFGSISVLAVSNKDNENFLGFCGLKNLKDDFGVLCFYTLLPEYRGYGYAIEAMIKLLDYAFLVLELPKIVTFINPKGSGSWKVAERIGMKYMGHVQYKNLNPKPMYFIIEKAEHEALRLY